MSYLLIKNGLPDWITKLSNRFGEDIVPFPFIIACGDNLEKESLFSNHLGSYGLTWYCFTSIPPFISIEYEGKHRKESCASPS